MITFRMANLNDVDLFFNWANDFSVRINSYEKANIDYIDHVKWFSKQIANSNNYFYVFLGELNEPIGQVRISIIEEHKAVIGIMIDAKFRGNGFASEMLKKASSDFLISNENVIILAYIFKSNTSSFKSFLNAGYILLREEIVNKIDSYILYKGK
jgi:RimJ/RimL family protein N-acetyltransferase